MSENHDSPSTITFLGTAGARFMVSRQLAASGGIWLSLDGIEILLDPGPGSIVQTTKRKLNAERLSAIIISHRHLDHAADVNIMIEAMTNGGFKRHGRLYAPADALQTEPVIFSYLKAYIEGITILEEGKTYEIEGVSMETPVRHQHPVETYGLIFRTPAHSIAYIADTSYFDDLARCYANCEILIVNMVFIEPRPPIAHLSVPEVSRLIQQIRPKLAILSHFGLHVWQAKPWLIAEEISKQTGVKVIAARDGMKFDLTQLGKE